MFFQIHHLTSYSATLLNRDDAGLAKRIDFGDAPRVRVSSQCLKRHWRQGLHQAVDFAGEVRTRHIFDAEILPRVEAAGVDPGLALGLVGKLHDALLKNKESKDPKEPKAKKQKNGAVEAQADLLSAADPAPDKAAHDKAAPVDLSCQQAILIGRPEVDYLTAMVIRCAADPQPMQALEREIKDCEGNLAALIKQAGGGDLFAGLAGALFGRFVTSDILSRSDACVHVAHSITTHALASDLDFFAAVDDLSSDGSAYIGDAELTAGIFYGYAAVDVALLVSNLTGCDPQNWRSQSHDEAIQILKALTTVIATVSPGAKKGATAPYSYADFALLEAGRGQPCSLANSYLRALDRDDGMPEAIAAMLEYRAAQERMYGPRASVAAMASTVALESDDPPVLPLMQAADRVVRALFE